MQREGGGPRSVLIVDNDRAFADALADMLREHDYAVASADTPERALSALSNNSAPPVVLIDADLGGGVAALLAVQPELVFAVMARGVHGARAVAALRAGAYDYLNKSAGPSAALAVLDRCFERVAAQRERSAENEALRRAKDDAEAANRGKSGFLATMSHELRTPLNAIIGFSEMMVREVLGSLGNEQYRSYAADIHESGAHLLQIINDILDLSKAEAGKLELWEEIFEVPATIRSVCQLVRARLGNSGLSVAVDSPPDLPLLRADERKTKQVLLNLVTNAIKFTPAGGRIEIIAAYSPAVGMTLAVIDTGVGIAPADLPRVMEPFEQVESSISRSHQGTGLGLPLVKAIMELHGGSLDLQSEVGVGTRVSVTFPPQRVVFDPSEPSRNAA